MLVIFLRRKFKVGVVMVKNKNQAGFTLMEMLIVVTIIGILAAIILPRFITSSAEAKASAYEAERQTINSQLELYYFHFGKYPTAMTNEGWGTGDENTNGRIDYQEFWPEGVPTGDIHSESWNDQYIAVLGRIE